MVELTRLFVNVDPRRSGGRALDRAAAEAILLAPGFTIRGGTTEILRGIIGRAVLTQP